MAGTFGLLAGGLSGCLSAPSYSETPSIEFQRIDYQRYPGVSGSLPVDSILVTINYQDGDGDLGLTAAEAAAPPYASGSGATSLPGTNWRATSFVKRANGVYDSLKTVRADLQLPKSYQYELFGHISATTDNRKSPLKGTMTRRYGFRYGNPYLPNQEIKFRISILDRALHQSNEVETTSIIIPTR